MTIRHLYTFVKVAELESVSKAAEYLHVAQPSVSQTIKELENYYSVSLFIRANKKLTLTKAGQAILIKAKDTVQSFSDFEDSVKKIKEVPEIKIGSSITFTSRAIPDLIHHLKKNIENLKFYLYIDKTLALEEKIINGELDFAIVEGLPTLKNIKFTTFAHDYLYLVAGNDYPIPDKIKLSDITKYEILTREANSNSRKHLEYALALKGIKLKPTMESVSSNAIIKMVINNLGISLIPRGLVESYIDKKLLRKIDLDVEFKRPLHIIYHKDKKLFPIIKKAMRLTYDFLENYRNDD